MCVCVSAFLAPMSHSLQYPTQPNAQLSQQPKLRLELAPVSEIQIQICRLQARGHFLFELQRPAGE